MRREEILKRIIENPDFKKKYWPEFETKDDLFDYGVLIGPGKSKNPFLLSLKAVLYEEADTERSLKRSIENNFGL